MTRSSLTRILLGGALAAACSKPNPLFLDTWGEVSDSGGHSESSVTAATVEPTAGTVTVTTDPPPTTTDPVTSSEAGSGATPGTTGPTSETGTETDGDPFFCQADMNGCCEVKIPVVADSFFSNATNGLGGDGCPLVNDPGEFPLLPCGMWCFGKDPALRIFNDPDEGLLEPIVGVSAIGLRFPMKDGQLVSGGAPIPWELVTALTLELAVEVDWEMFSALEFALYGLPADQEWSEGPGGEMLACTPGASSFHCLDCGANPNGPCTTEWTDFDPLYNELGVILAQQGQDPGRIGLPIAEMTSVAESPGGLVVLPFAATYGGQSQGKVPSGAIIAKARESGTPPGLRVRVCMN